MKFDFEISRVECIFKSESFCYVLVVSIIEAPL